MPRVENQLDKSSPSKACDAELLFPRLLRWHVFCALRKGIKVVGRAAVAMVTDKMSSLFTAAPCTNTLWYMRLLRLRRTGFCLRLSEKFGALTQSSRRDKSTHRQIKYTQGRDGLTPHRRAQLDSELTHKLRQTTGYLTTFQKPQGTHRSQAQCAHYVLVCLQEIQMMNAVHVIKVPELFS